MDIVFTADFWISLLQIVWVNLLLSGDNAVVIALAARSLPAHQQKKAIYIGTIAAIILRIILTIVAASLLQYPWLKSIGGILLLYIGVSLVFTNDGEEKHATKEFSLFAAIRYILIADLVMSLDNVLAVAAAAGDSMILLILGLLLGIPLIIFGSTVLLKVVNRFPIIVWLGAALLGYIAGEMVASDPAQTVQHFFAGLSSILNVSHQTMEYIAGAVGAVLVLVIAGIVKSIKSRKSAA